MKTTVPAMILVAALMAGAPASAAAPPSKSAETKEVLPWIHDDYTQALARAKAKKLPLFVEAWAPW